MIRLDELKVLPFGRHRASYNMALDSRLLDLCERDPRCGFLRLYQWDPPALSVGFFEPEETIDLDLAARSGIDVVRRPTGGRVVLHCGDLTYSLVIPRRAESSAAIYALVSECIAAGLRSLGVSVGLARGTPARSGGPARPCFLATSRHEIVYRGRKVVGSAQRALRSAVLQHGSIPIDRGYLGVVDYLKCADGRRSELKRDMLAATACVDEILGAPARPADVAAALTAAFVAGLRPHLGRISSEARPAVDAGGRVGLTP